LRGVIHQELLENFREIFAGRGLEGLPPVTGCNVES